MKIYKRIVVDIDTGRTVAAESFDYTGPVASAKSQKTTVKTTLPRASAAELQDQAMNRALNLLNLSEMGYEAKWVPMLDKNGKPLRSGEGYWDITERALTAEEQERKDRNTELETLAYNRLKGVSDPATQKLVGDVFNAQREAGNDELTRYMNEQAAARGLDITDTPLLREVGLQKGRLETGLRGAEAASLLDVGQRNQLFAQAMREFQTNLQQQAFINRSSIADNYAQNALGMGRMRAMQPTTVTSAGGGGFDFMSALMGGIQGAGAGGQAGGPWGAVGGGIAGFGLGGLSGSGRS